MTGPADRVGWWDLARQAVLFLLGVAILVYELVTPDARGPLEAVGLILVGMVPVDALLSAWARRPKL